MHHENEGSAASKIENHYQDDYFNNFQKRLGEFGGIANKFLFEDHIQQNDTVLDFGCGGGFLLKNLDCKQKIGVEINPVAREFCNKENKVTCYESLDAVQDNSVDVIISSHCLEHVTSPFDIIQQLNKKLKVGGRIVIVVPLESHKYKWVPNDINNHLYSFSPMNLGNLLQGTGFTRIAVEPVLHQWVPRFFRIQKTFGWKGFHRLSWIYGKYFTNKALTQVKATAIKES